MNLKWIINGMKNANPDEAIAFHLKALPIFIIVCLAFYLTGCGSNQVQGTTIVEVPKIIETTITEDTIQGTYFFVEESSGEISGALGITVDFLGRIDVEEVEQFRSTNFNSTFGLHPRISFSNITQRDDDTVIYAGDVTYTAAHDLESDGSTTNLSAGRHYTVYTLSFDENDALVLTIQIHSGSTISSGGINSIIIEREFKEL
jgi:hypothetical protein